MNEPSQPQTFVFAIIAQHAADGRLVDYALQSTNEGIREEIVFTLLRHWLKMSEHNYHAAFSGRQKE
jgi:hypothetical protein